MHLTGGMNVTIHVVELWHRAEGPEILAVLSAPPADPTAYVGRSTHDLADRDYWCRTPGGRWNLTVNAYEVESPDAE
jgi:hypothetical protein